MASNHINHVAWQLAFFTPHLCKCRPGPLGGCVRPPSPDTRGGLLASRVRDSSGPHSRAERLGSRATLLGLHQMPVLSLPPSLPPTPTGQGCSACYLLCPQMPGPLHGRLLGGLEGTSSPVLSTGFSEPFPPRGAQATAPLHRCRCPGGELPSFGCRPPRLREAASKAPPPILRPPPPLGTCVGKLLIDFTLVKNVNKLQMTSSTNLEARSLLLTGPPSSVISFYVGSTNN